MLRKVGIVAAIGFAAFILPKTGLVGATNPIEAKARRDETFKVRTGDPAMEAARAKGRATLDAFLAVNEKRPPNSRAFSVKIPVREGTSVEWIWVKDFRRNGDQFRGVVDNVPRWVLSIRSGQTVDFAHADIADWMYVQDGRLKGNFTACALLAKEEPKARDEFIRKFGMDCSA